MVADKAQGYQHDMPPFSKHTLPSTEGHSSAVAGDPNGNAGVESTNLRGDPTRRMGPTAAAVGGGALAGGAGLVAERG